MFPLYERCYDRIYPALFYDSVGALPFVISTVGGQAGAAEALFGGAYHAAFVDITILLFGQLYYAVAVEQPVGLFVKDDPSAVYHIYRRTAPQDQRKYASL